MKTHHALSFYKSAVLALEALISFCSATLQPSAIVRMVVHTTLRTPLHLYISVTVVAGDYLRDKYDGATEVRANRRGKLQIRDRRFSLPTANDLVYIEESPNYCLRNISLGSLGQSVTSHFQQRPFIQE